MNDRRVVGTKTAMQQVIETPFGSQWKVPKEWELVSLKDITSDWRGGAPFEPEDFTAHGFPVLHKGGIQRGGNILIDSKKKTFTTEEYAQNHQKSVIDKSYMAATLRDLVPSGPSIGLIADLRRSPSEKYILAQGAYGFLIDIDRVKPMYLVWLSNYEPFREYIKRYCVGSTQIHIRTPIFQELKIPLPPIAEQKRIAAILDKAEELRGLRRKALGELDAISQSIFLEMFGDPVTNPKGWETHLLGNLTVEGLQNGLYKASSDYGEGTPILRIDAFYNGRVTKLDSLKRVRISLAEQETYGLQKDDIVINRVNSIEYLGKSALIPRLLEPVIFESNMIRFRLDRKYACPRFIVEFLQTPFIKSQIRTGTKDAVNQSSINQQDVKAFQIRVPPLPLQQEFARRVEAIEHLKTTHRESLAQLGALFASLQHRAFRGEL